MSDLDKSRTQHDAQRTVASRRRTGSSRSEQAILRHLGVELYKESHRRNNTSGQPDAEDATDASPDR
ncbi:hypothetical protein OG558_23325 [Kribbella sp. NBC_01510]|uniref:hypothetical protein n=1 Tax=Kribbella sp. NBC_01510 TaxID=2903581 RepID=UPI00386A0C31